MSTDGDELVRIADDLSPGAGNVLRGHCLCGAVTVEATPERNEIHACHCDMCRRWTGSVFLEIDVADHDLAFAGPVRSFASSHWAERAWCDRCGSTLWYRITLPGRERYAVSAGLFENAGGFTLAKEIYIDRKPDGFAFAGTHRTETKADFEARIASIAQGEF